MANIERFIDLWKRQHFYTPEEIDVGGWCDAAFGQLLYQGVQNCLASNEAYLEVGTFCGRSLIYALRGNDKVAHVIDPLPDTMPVAQESVWQVWNRNIDRFAIRDRVILHRTKLEDFAEPLSNIGLAYIDGNHDSGHTLMALRKCEQYLSHTAIIIVDDYNIHGGDGQTPYPGHPYEFKCPVRKDVNQYLAERYANVSVIGYTPYLNGQIYLSFRRSP